MPTDSEFSKGRRNAFANKGKILFFAGSDIRAKGWQDSDAAEHIIKSALVPVQNPCNFWKNVYNGIGMKHCVSEWRVKNDKN